MELGVGAVWLVGLGAALLLLELVLGRSPLGAAIAGAVLADIVAGFAGVRWDMDADGRPSATPIDASTALRRVAIGMAAAAAAAVITLLAAGALGWIRVEAGAPSKTLGLALVRGAAIGVREELFLRGIVLVTAARAGVRPLYGAIFAALAGGAAIALVPGAGPSAMALAVGSGLLFATLWQRERGAWAAASAHGLWLFLVGSAIRGGIIDVTWKEGSLTSGARSFGGPAWLAAVVCVLIALGLRYGPRRKTEAESPSPSQTD